MKDTKINMKDTVQKLFKAYLLLSNLILHLFNRIPRQSFKNSYIFVYILT